MSSAHRTQSASRVRRSSPRWLVAGAISALLLGASFTTAGAQPTGSDWSQYLHDSARSGFTGETLINPSNAASLKVKTGWPVQLHNGALCPSTQDYCSDLIASQPTIATVSGNTLVYVGSWNGDEYALCASTCTIGTHSYSSGQIVWNTYVGRTSGCGGPLNSQIAGVTGAAAVGTAVINSVSTTVVFAGAGGDLDFNGNILSGGTSQLFALDALSGAVLWHTSLGSAPDHYLWSSPVLANGSLYIGIASRDDCPLIQGGVVQIDPGTGHVLNTFNTVPNGCIGASVWGSPTVENVTGNVYVATGNGGSCRSAERYQEAVIKLSPTLGFMSSWQIPAKQEVPDGDFGNTPTLFPGTVTPTGTLRGLLGVANKNGYYYVFDTAHISSGPVKKLRVAIGGSDPEKGGGSISPSSWDGTYVYVAGGNTTISGTSYTGSIRAYNPNNLKAPVWEHGLNGGPVLAAVCSDPGLAVAGAGAFTNVVNSANGGSLFTGVASGFYAAPSIAYGVLWEGDTSGMLHAYSVNGQ